MSPEASERPLPRQRLLEAADRLFYEEGVCSVGIDRILKEADVARASLYGTYGSKDELLRAYLRNRSQGWQGYVAEVLPTRWDTPSDRIIGIFQLLTEWFETPGYRGCPFINASAETVLDPVIEDVRDDHRGWVRALFTGLASDAQVPDPGALTAQLVLLYDGSMAGAQMDHSAQPGGAAQAAAHTLLKAALG